MRKHFLILMLLTLLPMATWAIDITGKAVTFDPAATSTAYDGASHNLPEVTAVAGATGALTVKWYYGESTTPLTENKYKDAGTYTVHVTTNNDTGEATATFTVTKVEVEVKAEAITTGVTYGDEPSVVLALGKYEIDLDDVLAADKETVGDVTSLKEGVITGTVTGYTTTYTKGTAVGATSTITPVVTGLSSVNYKFKAKEASVTVKKKDLAATMIKSIGTFVEYNALDQKPATIVMRDDAVSTVNNLVVTTDYTFSFKKGSEVVTEAKNAGTYTIVIAGAGNYKGTVTKDFTIERAGLLIKTKGDGTSANYFKTYDGALKTWTAGTDDYANFIDVQGYQDGTFATTNANLQLSIVPVADGTGSTDGDAGEYNLTIAPVAGKTWETVFPNYRVITQNKGKYTIKKYEYGFTVTNQAIAYDAANPFAADIADAKDYITISVKTAPSTLYTLPTGFTLKTYPTLKAVTVNGKGSYDLEMKENTAVIVKDATAPATPVDKTKNFDIKLTNGKLIVAGGVIAVIPDDMNWTYGADAPTPGFELAGLRDDVSDADLNALNKVVTKYISYSDGVNAGTHEKMIVVDAEKILAELPAGVKANYEEVKGFKATYTIKKRQLTKIIVADQSINISDNEDDLVEADNVTFVADGYELKDYDYELLNNEFTVAFTAKAYMTADEVTAETTANTAAKAADNYTSLAANAKTAWDAAYAAAHPNFGLNAGDLKRGTTDLALTIALVNTTNKFTNFELPQKKDGSNYVDIALASDGDAKGTKGLQLGALTVSAPVATLTLTDLGTGNTLPATILAANKGNKVGVGETPNAYTDGVKITLNRTQKVAAYSDAWTAQKWNALVLPFDITVDELADVIGYCIVNVASGNATEDKISFKLEMGNIPANTPFMVKTTKRVPAGTTWNFGVKTIANFDYAEEDPSVDAGAGNTFVGTYKGVIIDKNHTNWRWNAGESWPHFGASSASSYLVQPFNAYLQINPDYAARDITIEFEELDGSTTAINSIDADFQVINAKGWYTINGMKLDAAPTEKGIYINNGKKVVIK